MHWTGLWTPDALQTSSFSSAPRFVLGKGDCVDICFSSSIVFRLAPPCCGPGFSRIAQLFLPSVSSFLLSTASPLTSISSKCRSGSPLNPEFCLPWTLASFSRLEVKQAKNESSNQINYRNDSIQVHIVYKRYTGKGHRKMQNAHWISREQRRGDSSRKNASSLPVVGDCRYYI